MCTYIWCAKRICENAARPRAFTRGTLTNSCTDKISLELVSGLVRRRGGLSLVAWEWDGLRRGCGSLSRAWVPVAAGVWDAKCHRKTHRANISFLMLGGRARQNCPKTKKNTFTPSKTAVCSALPAPHRGVTYSSSGVAPAYSSSVFFF